MSTPNNTNKPDNPKVEHDPVSKPAHYRLHSSGVECIELAEILSFNIGNAFKYVFRRDDKENSVQDLQKAKWYLLREIQRLQTMSHMPLVFHRTLVSHPDLSEYHVTLIRKVLNAEQVLLVRNFYSCIIQQTGPTHYIEKLTDALQWLSKLIKIYERHAARAKRINPPTDSTETELKE